MHRYLTILIMAIALSSFPTKAIANDSTYKVVVTQDTEPDYVDDGPVRQRSPSKPIMYTISRGGLFIPSINSEDIILFEVYSLEGNCMVTFTSETDFISFIYSINGNIELRIYTNKYVLHGFLSL